MIPQRQKQKNHTAKPEEAPPCSGVFFVASKAVGSSRWAKLLRSAFEPAACTDVNFSLAKYTFHNEPSTTKPVAAGGSCLMQRVQKFSERPTICPIAQRGFSVSAYPSSSERVLAFRDSSPVEQSPCLDETTRQLRAGASKTMQGYLPIGQRKTDAQTASRSFTAALPCRSSSEIIGDNAVYRVITVFISKHFYYFR